MNNVVIYSKNNCMQCKMTKRFLKENDVTFEERNVNEKPEYVDYLKQQGFKSVPIVFTESEDPIIGFQPSKLQEIVK